MTIYFYKGDMLSKYCKDKGYKYSKIVSRVYNRGITVEDAVKSYEEYDAKGKQYPRNVMWKLPDGRGLRQACLEEGVNYDTVKDRVHKGQSIDEAFYGAQKNKGNKKTSLKFFYKGIPLVDYCRENNIGYCGVLYRIHSKKISVEEAVEKAKEKESVQRYKYFYKGMLLSKYCKEKGYSICSITRRIKKNNMSVEDALLDYLKSKKKRENWKSRKRGLLFPNTSFKAYLNKIKERKKK